MYVRPPSSPKGSVKIPDNYSGNAFSRQPIYAEMPPPTRTAPMQRQEDIAHHSATLSDLPPHEIQKEFNIPKNHETDEQRIEEKAPENATSTVSSIFSSLLPKGALSTHFPFGHGIGGEELLILAVMLLVFLSGNETGETDGEFILLLGLLLFAG